MLISLYYRCFGHQRKTYQIGSWKLANMAFFKRLPYSGYGKTSLINAGLIPAIKKLNDYEVYYIRSGNNPWDNIKKVLFNTNATTFDVYSVEVGKVSRACSKTKYCIIAQHVV